MTVIQINLWTCDNCGAMTTTQEETSVYSDPVIQYPQGWGTYDKLDDAPDFCSECINEIKKSQN